jgi:LruC domain-containing protein
MSRNKNKIINTILKYITHYNHMKKTLLITALFGLFAVVSCKKDAKTPAVTTPSGPSLNSVTVPTGFLWQNSRYVTVTVSSTDSRFAGAIHKVSIYNGDPNNGGQLISQGSATLTNAFSSKLFLSAQITQLYVVKTAPDLSTITQTVPVGNSDVSLSIGSTDPNAMTRSVVRSEHVTTAAGSPDCNSGCTLPVITASTSNIDLNSGDVLCVTGSNITVNFRNLNGGTIRICGSNVTVQNLNLSGSTTLLVTTGGSANLSSVNFNSSAASVINYGTVTYSGSFPDNGIFTNYGAFNCGGDFNLNGQAGVFTNNGTLTIGGSFQDGTSAIATNNSSMSVGGNFQPNSNSAFVNNCSLTVGGNYNQSSGVKNYSFIQVGGTSTINSNSQLGLYNSAMLLTKNLIVDGSIVGYGSTSLVKITGSTTIENQGSVVSNVQVYALNTLNSTSSSKITGGAALGSTVYIPTSGCNGVGNGTPAVVDSDGDGVPDNLDAYPNDPTKAYNVTGGKGTLAFEDNWPNKGDFDFNDAVVTYSYNIVTSAQNNVVVVQGTYSLVATGGVDNNAFGIQFPVSASSVSGLAVTRNTVAETASFEAGQTYAVVFLYTNMRNEMANWNTVLGSPVSPAVNYTVTFNVANGPNISTFGLDEYNPFICSIDRGHEVHMAGKAPTALANTSLFGTQDDNTNVATGTYFLTKAGLPFALCLPVTNFAYPIEGVDITKAYLYMPNWATSGAAGYSDWYSNTASGYRNTAYIY